jgi:hypothetical protein
MCKQSPRRVPAVRALCRRFLWSSRGRYAVYERQPNIRRPPRAPFLAPPRGFDGGVAAVFGDDFGVERRFSLGAKRGFGAQAKNTANLTQKSRQTH